jgi:hypothetical protein
MTGKEKYQMNWQTVREHCPKQWLLIEAIKARSEGGKRILEQISVIHVCSDSRTAMNEYRKLKKEAPAREMFALHTSNPEIEITERQWLGIRGYNGDALAAWFIMGIRFVTVFGKATPM